MRVLIAPDSFKGTLTAEQAARAMASGVRRVDKQIETVLLPLADGGEGTLDILHSKLGGRWHTHSVFNPFAALVQAANLHLNDGTVVVEMARASGLGLIPASRLNNRSAMRASTYGTGELVRAALESGAQKIIFAVGGSATTDGGFGFLEALGAVYFDEDGNVLDGKDSAHLARVARIDVQGVHPKFSTIPFVFATDVTNPLCGPNGAAYVFGPQKGLNAAGVAQRDTELRKFASLLADAFGTAEDVSNRAGAGAAGGIGLPLLLHAHTEIQSGAQWIGNAIGFESVLKDCDCVMTGEGKSDGQSGAGKVPAYVAQLARKYDKSCIVVSGALGEGHASLFSLGVTHMIAATPEDANKAAMRENASAYVQQASFHVVSDWMRQRDRLGR